MTTWTKRRRESEVGSLVTALQALFVGCCLTSQQHASVSQGRICSDKFTCCHTEIEAADQTFYLTQSQYTDTRPTNPSADPIMPGAWQGSYWTANFHVTGMTRPGKSRRKRDSNPRSFALEADVLTTRPTRRCSRGGREEEEEDTHRMLLARPANQESTTPKVCDTFTTFSFIYPVVWLTVGAPLDILQPTSSTPRGSQLSAVSCSIQGQSTL